MKKLILSSLLLLSIIAVRGQTSPSCGPFTVLSQRTLHLLHDTVIRDKIILVTDTLNPLLKIDSCYNLTLINCRFPGRAHGGSGQINHVGIWIQNSHHITIKHCYIDSTAAGVFAVHCSNGHIKVDSNFYRNIQGPFYRGNFVQFSDVDGGGNTMNYNRCWDDLGNGKPEDGLSLYKCNGLPGDSIQVIGNWIRGGQYYNTSGGGAGIVIGDLGGSYQVARNNIVVDGGYVGMQVQGGVHIKMDHNTIESRSTPYSQAGLGFGNYSGHPSSDVNISYNKVKFIDHSGHEDDEWWDPATAFMPAGWSTNILGGTLSDAILPTQLWTLCSSPVLPPVISYAGSPLSYTYGVAITPLTPSHTGGAPTSYSGTLPAGLSLNTLTGVISGIPTAPTASATYHITGSNSSGSTMANITIVVNKAPLMIQANAKSRLLGVANPTLTWSTSGWQRGETESSLLTPVTISTTAVTSSPVGSYDITVAGATSNNYSIMFMPAKLTVDQGVVLLRIFSILSN